MLRNFAYLISAAALLFMFIPQGSADTVYFKNGNVIEGIVTKDGKDYVELNVGFGTIQFQKNEIEKICPGEDSVLYEKWEAEKQQAELSRLKSQEELKKIREELAEIESRKLKESVTQKTTEVSRQTPQSTSVEYLRQDKNILVYAILVEGSRRVLAKLMVDTGASVLLLSQDTAAKLGISTSASEKDKTEVVLADGRRVKAKYVSLDLVAVGEVHTRKVGAVVLLDETAQKLTQSCDGLLGMSFLKRFYFMIDPKTDKLILRELD